MTLREKGRTSFRLRHLFYVEIASTILTFVPLLIVPRWFALFFFNTADVPAGTRYALAMYGIVAIVWAIMLLGGLRAQSEETRAWALRTSVLGDALMIVVSLYAIFGLGIVSLGSTTHAAVTAVYMAARIVALARPSAL